QNPSQFFSLANNPSLTLLQNGLVGTALGGGGAGGSSDLLTSIVNALSGAASQAYSALLPTADSLNALLTTIPAYDVHVFFSELAGGHLLDAILLPVAADAGLFSFLGGYAFAAVGEGLAGAVIDLLSPFVDVSKLLP
ncbi:MAG: hypothetical protein ACRDTN_12195, partial [Mycobacterium sp.]